MFYLVLIALFAVYVIAGPNAFLEVLLRGTFFAIIYIAWELWKTRNVT